jgi:hypothetical protein
MLNNKPLLALAGTAFLLTFIAFGSSVFAQSASAPTTADVCAFPQNIQIGDHGTYVTCLQNYLILHEYLDKKKDKGVYDEATQAAFTSFRTDLKLGGTNATPVYMLPFVDDKTAKHGKDHQ